MLPEIQEFMLAKEKADKEINDWHAHSRDDAPKRPDYPDWGADTAEREAYEVRTAEYEEKYREWHRKFRQEHSDMQNRYLATLNEARAKLKSKTKDPIARWILNNIDGYESYVEKILPILPATRAELEEVANEHDWCSEFDSFMDMATEAGVIPADESGIDVTEICDYIAERTDEYARHYRRDVHAMVKKIVDQALEAQAAQHNELIMPVREREPVAS